MYPGALEFHHLRLVETTTAWATEHHRESQPLLPAADSGPTDRSGLARGAAATSPRPERSNGPRNPRSRRPDDWGHRDLQASSGMSRGGQRRPARPDHVPRVRPVGEPAEARRQQRSGRGDPEPDPVDANGSTSDNAPVLFLAFARCASELVRVRSVRRRSSLFECRRRAAWQGSAAMAYHPDGRSKNSLSVECPRWGAERTYCL